MSEINNNQTFGWIHFCCTEFVETNDEGYLGSVLPICTRPKRIWYALHALALGLPRPLYAGNAVSEHVLSLSCSLALPSLPTTKC